MIQHKNHEGSVFTTRYNINKLVYYEVYTDIRLAIQREKQIKGGTREAKIALINSLNSEWRDLSADLFI